MIRFSLTAACLAAALAGCASPPRELARATAVEDTVRAEMTITSAQNGLTWDQQALIARVAQAYKARGHGPLVISHPDPANDGQAVIAAIAETRSALYAHGLDWRSITGGAYGGRGGEDTVVFSFEVYRAVAPDCPPMNADLSRADVDAHWPRFGCATAQNLAAMVADPRDLVAPRGLDPRDNLRRDSVLEAWRAGRPTGAERSEAEDGAVSDVDG